VLAFILGRGVLVLPLSLPQFVAVMLAPFMPAQMMAQQLMQNTAAAGAKTPAAAAEAQPAAGRAAVKLPRASQLAVSAWQQVTPMQRCSIDVKPSSRPHAPAAAATAAAGNKQIHTARSGSIPVAVQSKAAQPPQQQRIADLLLNAAVVAAFAAYTCGSKQRFVSTLLHLGSLGLMWRAMELLMVAASVPARDWLGEARWLGSCAGACCKSSQVCFVCCICKHVVQKHVAVQCSCCACWSGVAVGPFEMCFIAVCLLLS
jgi:hypothetical protein